MHNQPGVKTYHVVRRKSNRPKTKLAKFARLLLAAVAVVGVLGCTYLLIAKATRPYFISYAESKDITNIKRQIASEETSNTALKDQIAYLKTPRGKEVEARKLGWVRDGEIALVVQQGNQSADSPTPTLQKKRKTFWQLADKHFLGVFRATSKTKD